MTLKEFLADATIVVDSVKKHAELFDFLTKISSFNETYVNLYKKLKNSYTDNANTTQQRIAPIINEIKSQDDLTLKEVRKYRPRDFFIALESLKSGINQTKIFGEELSNFHDIEISKLCELHTDAYSERKFDDLLSFVVYCSSFLGTLRSFKFASSTYLKSFDLEPELIPKNNQIIDIQIVSECTNLEEFTLFLSFIEELYQKLCLSFSIHYDDFPLTIIKIESGSIWSKLFGNNELIGLIKDFMFGLGRYIRDLQTGKISRERFENTIKKADLIADLMLKAKEIGLSDENQVLLERTFGEAVGAISKALPKMTTEVFVNDEPLIKLNQKETKAIEGKTPLMLEQKNDKEGKKPSA